MTKKLVVNAATGESQLVDLTADEQAAYDAQQVDAAAAASLADQTRSQAAAAKAAALVIARDASKPVAARITAILDALGL